MRAMAVLMALLALQDPAADPCAQAVREAATRTGTVSYRYRVGGRFDRTGEFAPPATLTSSIGGFRSARHGARILVKGPDGLWKTPGERIGEKTEKPGADDDAIVRTLEEAQPPHEMIAEYLALAARGSVDEDIALGARVCTLPYDKEKLRRAVDEQMRKSIERGGLEKPDDVKWASLQGRFRAWVDRKTGVLQRFRDERSVKIVHRRQDAADDVRTYRIEMEFTLSDHGTATIDLPAEVRQKLKLED